MALWSGGVHVAAILFLTMTSYLVDASPGYVVCYYSSWAHYRQGLARYTVEDIPVELCTHLIYAFATLDSKTFLAKPFDPWLDIDLKNYEKFVQLKKKNPKMKVLLGVGGWNDSRTTKYSRMVADPNKRKSFVEEVVKLLLQYGFDGLDLDWEYPAYESRREDKQGFTYWVEDLKAALSPHGLLLSSAVSAGRYNIDRGYDIPKVAKHLDFINLMSYDFHGSWEKVVAHHSPLYPEVGQNPEFCTDFAVNYWIKKGAPAHKLVLGVPFYGRSWTLAGSANYPGSAAVGAGKRGKYVKEKGHMAYFECCLAHQNDGWSKITGDGGPYLTKDDQWVGYDDIEAVTKKAEYALSKGLGGIMVWDTVSDDFNNACGHGPNPLLTAIAKTLQGKSPPSKFSRHPTTPPSVRTPTTTATSVKVWRGGNVWKPQPDQGDNSIGGTTKVKGSSTFGSGSSQTTKPPYVWQAWPIFNKSPGDTQNSIVTTTPSSITTTRRDHSFRGTTKVKGSSTFGSGSSQTTKPPYQWQAWPIFNKSPGDTQNSIVTTTPSSITTTRRDHSFRGTTKVKGSSTFGSGSSQTTKPPYQWQAWPIFNKSPGDTQNSIVTTTPSSITTTRRDHSFRGTTKVKGSSTFGSGSSQTTKPPYQWQAWPIFNKSPGDTQNSIVTTTPSSITTTRRDHSFRGTTKVKGSSTFGSGSSQTTKPPYQWQAWPVFNKSPEDTQNSISSSHSATSSSGTPTSPSVSSSFPTFPSSSSFRLPASSSALTWFADCKSFGFASDPASCSAFYRCTDNYAYRFTCPGGLLWHQDESACDWSFNVQCILPLSKPNVQAFLAPKNSAS